MKSSGWLGPLAAPISSTPTILHTRGTPDEECTATEWKGILDTMRKDILDARDVEASQRKLPVATELPVSDEPDWVKLVDK